MNPTKKIIQFKSWFGLSHLQIIICSKQAIIVLQYIVQLRIQLIIFFIFIQILKQSTMVQLSFCPSNHNLFRHLDDVLDVVDPLQPIDRDSGDTKLGSEASPDEDGSAAAVAAGQHVRPQGRLVGRRVQQAGQRTLKEMFNTDLKYFL